MKLLQINITANWGSHGKIAEGIGLKVIQQGGQSLMAYGRWLNPSQSELYRIGSMADEYAHGVMSLLFDAHGLHSKWPTKKLISYIQQENPDIVHLHNVHGYYLHYPMLFRFLRQWGKPVVWTLHDCWPFTGHCAHYMYADCNKWQQHCNHCPLLSNYPKCVGLDRSQRNFSQKKEAFLIPNATLVPVSRWLEGELRQSFMANMPIKLIHNGIDTELFRPDSNHMKIRQQYNIATNKQIVLGIASNWYRKGLPDFIKLASMLPPEAYQIVLVGIKKKDLKGLPPEIVRIPRTDNVAQLIQLYSTADVLFNPTWEDNLPTTNLEAQACGTPVVTYDTGGSRETIAPEAGIVVEKGNLQQALQAIINLSTRQLVNSSTRQLVNLSTRQLVNLSTKKATRQLVNSSTRQLVNLSTKKATRQPANSANQHTCRQFVVDNFNKDKNFQLYLNLYQELLAKQQ